MVKLYEVATLADIPGILELAEHAASRYDTQRLFEYNAVVFTNTLKFLITQPTAAVIIEKVDGQVTGILGLLASQHFYSTAIIVAKLFWFAGSKKSSVKLLNLGRSWAKSIKADYFTVSQPHSEFTYGKMQSVDISFIEGL